MKVWIGVFGLSCCWIAVAVPYNDPCNIRSGGNVETMDDGITKRVSTFSLSGSNVIMCAGSTGADPLPGTSPQPQPNLQVQFMPDQNSKQFQVLYDSSLSDGLIEGQGVSGPEIVTAGTVPAGEINMVVGSNGVVVGSARSGNSIFHFTESPYGHSTVTEIRLEDLPSESDPEMRPDETRRALRWLSNTPQLKQSSPYIDVLVPYTKRAFCNVVYSYSTTKCRVDNVALDLMKAFVELNIFESNQAFSNSGIDGRFRLAQMFMVDPEFDEEGMSYPSILRSLAMADGVVDEVLEQRDQWGGDVVVLLVDNPLSCGLAYTGYPVDRDWAYAVVNWQCATGYYSFVHEIAHTLGANHDRVSESCPKSACCKKGCSNYGYQDPSMLYRTIMAYDCPVAGGCPRIQMFSQPSLPYYLGGKSRVVGDVSNNNAKQIKATWDIVANYREENSGAILVQISPGALKRVDPCGNGVCEPELGEDCQSCSKDCIGGTYKGFYCGDGICSHDENCENCPHDCASRQNARKELNYCCVGGVLGRNRKKRTIGEDFLEHAVGCKHSYCRWNTSCDVRSKNVLAKLDSNTRTFCCGNGVCELGETDLSCPTDCKGQMHTLPELCMADGRFCAKISPNPCCGFCNLETRKCQATDPAVT